MMTDYFATKTTQVAVLAWSKHTRDMFQEMRKAAERFEKTAHLGRGKGMFRVELRINHNKGEGTLWIENYGANKGGMYYKGDRMPPHFLEDILPNCEKDAHGFPIFETRVEVEAFVQALPTMEGCDWEISGSEQAIEHREKYSMGAGYYLKASSHYSDGWLVCKQVKHGDNWPDEVLLALAQLHFLEA